MGNLAEYLNSLPLARRMYKLQAMPKIFAQSSDVSSLYNLLTDFNFIEAKVSALGVQPLIEDYDLAFNSDVLFSGEKVDSLRLIQGALRLSAHVLDKDKTQLAGQLLGRLMLCEVPDIQAMLEQAKQGQPASWFRTLTPSLKQAGGPLLQTLTGHLVPVNAVAIIADGQRAISASGDYDLKIWDLKTGTELQTLEGHTQEIWAIAVTLDGHRAIRVGKPYAL